MAHCPVTNIDTQCKIRRMELIDAAAIATVHTTRVLALKNGYYAILELTQGSRVGIFSTYPDKEIVGYI